MATVSNGGEYFRISVDVATRPSTGDAVCGAWWLRTPAGLLFWSRTPLSLVDPDSSFLDVTPQCNASRAVVETVRDRMGHEGEVVQVPVVFMSSVRAHVRELAKGLRGDGVDEALGPAPGAPGR